MHQERAELNLRLPPDWQAPPDIQSRLGVQVGRQRAIIDENMADGQKSPLLLVLHEIPERGQPREGTFYWWDRNHQWFIYRQGEAYNPQEDGLAALSAHVGRYEAMLDQLRDDYEEARRAYHYLAILENVALKGHAADNLHRTLETARTFMREKQIAYEVEIINLRDRAYNLKREFDLLYLDTQNALDYREAQASEVLNLLILIFFPLSLIASLIQTGITDQILTIAPAIDPLIMTICLLAAALLLGVGLYLLITPSRKRFRRTRKRTTQRDLDSNSAPVLRERSRATPAAAPDGGYRHPLSPWRMKKRKVSLDKNMAQYVVEDEQKRRKK
jgi:hypothetical protein